MKRFHVLISGIVTGVFFRSNIKKLADSLNVKGFVRNIDGEVEALFEGDDGNVGQMLNFCRQGPQNAVIENIEINEEEYKGEFDSFEILY